MGPLSDDAVAFGRLCGDRRGSDGVLALHDSCTCIALADERRH